MILDLKRIHEVYMNRRGGSDFSWERKMTELVTSLLEYTAAKRDMTDLYPTCPHWKHLKLDAISVLTLFVFPELNVIKRLYNSQPKLFV